MTEKFKAHINVPFPTKRLAEIAYDALRVDAEPKRSGVTKDLSIQDNILTANFTADSVKQLRVAVNYFFSNLTLIEETVEFAGPPVSVTYSYYS